MKLKLAIGIFIICLFVSIQTAFSQTEKGRFIYGGEAYLSMISSTVFRVGFQPQFGGFPVRNFAIIGLLHFSIGPNDISYYNSLNAGGGPEFRYYVGGEKIKFYVFGSVLPLLNYSGQSRFAMRGGGGPALAVFPNRDLAINTSVFVGAYRLFANANPQFSLSFNVSINGLFSKKKKEKAEK